jgi:hypothetical protein
VFNIESQEVGYWNLFIQARAFSDIQELPSSLLFSMFQGRWPTSEDFIILDGHNQNCSRPTNITWTDYRCNIHLPNSPVHCLTMCNQSERLPLCARGARCHWVQETIFSKKIM